MLRFIASKFLRDLNMNLFQSQSTSALLCLKPFCFHPVSINTGEKEISFRSLSSLLSNDWSKSIAFINLFEQNASAYMGQIRYDFI